MLQNDTLKKISIAIYKLLKIEQVLKNFYHKKKITDYVICFKTYGNFFVVLKS